MHYIYLLILLINFIKISEVLKLSWEEVSVKTFDEIIPAPDILLAADVVYDPSIFKILTDAFYYFLNAKNNSQIILACTVRNSETLESFIKLLSKNYLLFI